MEDASRTLEQNWGSDRAFAIGLPVGPVGASAVLKTISRALTPSGPDLGELGGRLRYARHRARLTQQQAADRLGLAIHTIRRHELGQTQPSEHRLDELSRLYDVDSEWLRSGGAHNRPPGALAAPDQRAGIGLPSAPKAPLPAGRFVYICPRCGRRPLKPDELLAHLQGPFCVTPLDFDDAIAALAEARIDPQPWLNAIQRMRKEIDEVRREAKASKGAARRNLNAAADIMQAGMEKVRDAGAEKYEVPPDPSD